MLYYIISLQQCMVPILIGAYTKEILMEVSLSCWRLPGRDGVYLQNQFPCQSPIIVHFVLAVVTKRMFTNYVWSSWTSLVSCSQDKTRPSQYPFLWRRRRKFMKGNLIFQSTHSYTSKYSGGNLQNTILVLI